MKKESIQALLISSYYFDGNSLWYHCSSDIKKFIGIPEELHKDIIVFITYEKTDFICIQRHEVKFFFKKNGYRVDVVNYDNIKSYDITNKKIKAVVPCEGNSYLLMNLLKANNSFFQVIKERIMNNELKYIGNPEIIGPTLRTSNDMPIFGAESFSALNIIPFNVKSHLLSRKTKTGRIQRDDIRLFHLFNNYDVIALSEESVFKINKGKYVLSGGKAEIFRKNQKVFCWAPKKPFKE